jgi:predicted small secreted protein
MDREMRPVSAGENGNAWVRVVSSAAMTLVVLLGASWLLTACGDDGVAPVARPSARPQAPLCNSVPRLDRLVVARSDGFPQNHIRFSFPATITVTDAARVRKAAQALCELPKMPSGTFSCPADFAIVYHLAFSAAGERFPAVSVDATGCETVRGLTTTRWVARTPGFWRTLGEAMGLGEPSYATFRGIGPNG